MNQRNKVLAETENVGITVQLLWTVQAELQLFLFCKSGLTKAFWCESTFFCSQIQITLFLFQVEYLSTLFFNWMHMYVSNDNSQSKHVFTIQCLCTRKIYTNPAGIFMLLWTYNFFFFFVAPWQCIHTEGRIDTLILLGKISL